MKEPGKKNRFDFVIFLSKTDKLNKVAFLFRCLLARVFE